MHNVGITRGKAIARTTEPAWRSVLGINFAAQLRINDMLPTINALHVDGSIVCVLSINDAAGNLGQTNYTMSRAGVTGLMRADTSLLVEHGITTNVVTPGSIETQMTAVMPFAIHEIGRRVDTINQGDRPVDVAETTAWFTNPASSGATGNIARVCEQSLLGT